MLLLLASFRILSRPGTNTEDPEKPGLLLRSRTVSYVLFCISPKLPGQPLKDPWVLERGLFQVIYWLRLSVGLKHTYAVTALVELLPPSGLLRGAVSKGSKGRDNIRSKLRVCRVRVYVGDVVLSLYLYDIVTFVS